MMQKCWFEKVVIIGVGLIGGSLGLAGKAKGIFGKVVGVGRGRENLEQARERGAVDVYFHDPGKALPGADLVVLATPVQGIVTIGKEIAPLLEEGTLLTDVGSVKEELVKELESGLPAGVCFVGGHPIAGSEASGASAAREDLFLHRRTILTPTRRTDSEALARVHAMWESVGSLVVEMEADAHDTILAAVSHLPHMVAYALAGTLMEMTEDYPDITDYAAGGFRDMTRIAASHPEMWRDICRMNRKKIVEMIEQYEAVLEKIKLQIRGDHFETLSRTFQEAKNLRKKL
ncbi:MAG: prephenate dehydrogenase/arogenate dehydrogenase family protein [Deltaproteobacteria bacterium]|nr:prephenate dehydrogenase/arogenate dehydrogenase family protein [Deltaproteobacteria bacterium]